MASHAYDPRTGRARIFFRHGGRQFNRTVPVDSERAAARLCALIEETAVDLERGKRTLPAGADLAAFLMSGGRLAAAAAAARPEPVTLADLFARYRADPPEHLEPSTQAMQEIHFRRLLEVLPATDLRVFGKAEAQSYVGARARQKHHGRAIHRETIAKELKTLRQAWAWVAARTPGLPGPTFALKELSLPKGREALPFMSWEEIEREVARGGDAAALWDCLWLDRGRVGGLLEHVRQRAGAPFAYPLFAFAAYTGARRSELCRSRLVDWRLEARVVKIRQKKRDLEREFTFRDVPLHPALAEAMAPWLAAHPGGPQAICQADGAPLTWDAATHHFRQALAGSLWSVVRGWHVLRHSFASNLAAAGIDQRKIDRWMGHSTEIRWRYQHLRPEDQQADIGVL
jgi:integrase